MFLPLLQRRRPELARTHDPLSRLQKAIILALLLWAALTFGPDLGRPWLPLGSFGVQVNNDGDVSGVDGASLDPPGCIGPGDRILMRPSLRPQSALIALFKNNDGSLNPVIDDHAPLRLEIIRDMSVHPCTVRISRGETDWIVRIPVLLQDFIGILFICICARIIWQHPLPATWGLFLYSIWFNPALNFASYAEIERWPSLVLVEEFLQSVIQSAGYVGLIVFAVEFPNVPVIAKRRRVYHRALLALFVCLFIPQLASFGTAFGFRTELLNKLCYECGVAVDVAFGLILLARYRSAEPTDKQRIRWVLWGSLGLLGYIFADAVESSDDFFAKMQRLFHLDSRAEYLEAQLALPYVLSILLPLAVSVAIQRTRVFNVRILLSRVTTYSLVVAILLGIAWVAEEEFKELLNKLGLGWTTLLMIPPLAFIGEHLRRFLAEQCRRCFFPGISRFEERLDSIKRRFESARDFEQIDHLLLNIASDLDIASAAVFRKGANGAMTRTASVGWEAGTATQIPMELLSPGGSYASGSRRLELGSLGALHVPAGAALPVLALPVTDGPEVLAVALYGAHSKGDDLSDREVLILVELGKTAAATYIRCELHRLRNQLAEAVTFE